MTRIVVKARKSVSAAIAPNCLNIARRREGAQVRIPLARMSRLRAMWNLRPMLHEAREISLQCQNHCGRFGFVMLGRELGAVPEEDLDSFVNASSPARGNLGVRGSAARAYSCVRMAAPYDGHRLPPETAYCQVHCHELSASGISFFSAVRPMSELLVIRLNDHEQPLFSLTARIVSCDDENSDQLGRRFLVVCKFIKRLQ